MRREYEASFAEVEAKHPWFVARRRLFAALMSDAPGSSVLDFGCGTGSFLRYLKAMGHPDLAGVEPSPNLRLISADSGVPVHASWPERSFDTILMADVLEHIADDAESLGEAHRHLNPGGRLVLSVPAHPFLWSRHDELNEHFRRYTRCELTLKLHAAGFNITKLSYWNLSGLVPLAVTRLLRINSMKSELELGNRFLLGMFGVALTLENWLVRRIGLPFGVSLIAVASIDGSPTVE